VAHLERSAKREMIIEKQFPSVGELARRKKEVVCPAAKEPSDERKRALRGFKFVGERCSRHVLGVVTSRRNGKLVAPRMKLRPPTPNQAPEPTRLRGPFFVSGFSAHHRSYFERVETPLARVAHL
jgi:hypothetical protein